MKLWVCACFLAFSSLAFGELEYLYDRNKQRELVDHGVQWGVDQGQQLRQRAEETGKQLSDGVDRYKKVYDLVGQIGAEDFEEGHGGGIGVDFAAAVDVGGSIQAMRFGDRTHFYCGAGVGAVSDVAVGAKAFNSASVGCTSNNISGGTLSLSLSASLPGGGVLKQLNLSVDTAALHAKGGLLDQVAGFRRKIEAVSFDTVNALFTGVRKSLDTKKAGPANRAGVGVALALINGFGTSQKTVEAGVSALFDNDKDATATLGKMLGGINRPPEVKEGVAGLRDTMRKVAKEDGDAQVREAAGVYADIRVSRVFLQHEDRLRAERCARSAAHPDSGGEEGCAAEQRRRISRARGQRAGARRG